MRPWKNASPNNTNVISNTDKLLKKEKVNNNLKRYMKATPNFSERKKTSNDHNARLIKNWPQE